MSSIQSNYAHLAAFACTAAFTTYFSGIPKEVVWLSTACGATSLFLGERIFAHKNESLQRTLVRVSATLMLGLIGAPCIAKGLKKHRLVDITIKPQAVMLIACVQTTPNILIAVTFSVIKSLQDKNTTLQQQLADEIPSLKEQLRTLTDENTTLQQQLTDEIASLEEQLRTLTNEKTTLQQQLADKNAPLQLPIEPLESDNTALKQYTDQPRVVLILQTDFAEDNVFPCLSDEETYSPKLLYNENTPPQPQIGSPESENTSKIALLHEKIAELTDENADLQQYIDQIRAALLRPQQEASLEEDLSPLSETETDSPEPPQNSPSNMELAQQIVDSLEKSKSNKATLQQEIKELQLKITELTEGNRDLSDQLSTLQSTLPKAHAKISHLKTVKDTLQEGNDSLSDQLSTLKDALTQENDNVARLTVLKERLEQTNVQAAQRIESLQQENTVLKEQIQKLTLASQKLRDENTKFSTELAKLLQETNSNPGNTPSEPTHFQLQIDNLTADSKKLQQHIGILKTDNAQLVAHITHKEELQQVIETLKLESVDLLKNKEALNLEISNLELSVCSLAAKMSTLESAISNHHSQELSSKKRKTKTMDPPQDSTNETESQILKRENTEFSDKVQQLYTQLKRQDTMIHSIRDQLKGLRETSQTEALKYQKHIRALTEENEKLNTTLQEDPQLAEDYDTADKTCQRLHKENSSLSTQIAKLKERLDKARERYDILNTDNEEMRRWIDTLRDTTPVPELPPLTIDEEKPFGRKNRAHSATQ